MRRSIETASGYEVFDVVDNRNEVIIEIERIDDGCIQSYAFSKEAAQALGTALLTAASSGGSEYAISCTWDGRDVVISMTRELSGERWVTIDSGVFNASEAKALLAAIASCVAAMEAANGGDGDAR